MVCFADDPGLKADIHKGVALIWGAYRMNEYIFPGADAGIPLSLVVARHGKSWLRDPQR
ncbi:MAG: hypothetical protein IPM83_10640 [Ignavibacteria bacterium]|nr:hypothetical protein [Ignavibacteria bacterium]